MARLADANQQILLATQDGKAIRFENGDVRPMGRTARGVRGIKLGADDEVIGLLCLDPDQLVLSVSELGYGKRTKLDEYRLTNRGGKGVINMKITKKNGPVVAVMKMSSEIDVMIITRHGKIIRIDPDKIRATGRSAQGVRLVNVEDGDFIAAASTAPKSPDLIDDEDGDDDGQGVLVQ
jgi:DNA gyrase subunit A